LSHGWPLSADAWEDQMIFLAARGYRCIAHDRRGHGRSGQPWDGNEMDTYADDLAELVEALDLDNAIHIGHSTGGGKSPATSAATEQSALRRPCSSAQYHR
jgi:non-heme chloroperoxidase